MFQVISRRSRTSRARQSKGYWFYAAMAAAGVILTVLIAIHSAQT